jgi:peroxiredoxin
MKNYRFSLFLAFIIVCTGMSVFAHAENEKSSGVSIGQPVANFKLPDADGREQTLESIKGKNGTVLIFISTQCPMVRAYNERIVKLAEDYRARGINVVGINSNAGESTDDIKQQINDHHFSFVVLKDKNNKIADMLGAERTPEVFFLDATNKLVYHGRIDNHRDVSLVQANDLRDAIEATLAGKPVVKTEAAAFGCSIKRG